jgi:hypothetical protein
MQRIFFVTNTTQLFGVSRALKENVFLLCKAHSPKHPSKCMWFILSQRSPFDSIIMATIFYIQKKKQFGIWLESKLKSPLEAFDRIPMGF